MLVWSLLRFPTYGSGKVGKGFFESVQKLNRAYLKPLSRKEWI